MANATLITQRVQEIHLINKLEKNGQVQLDSSFSLNVSFTPDGSRCIGKLQQTLRDKEFAGGKFTMTIEMVGVFSCSEAYKDEVRKVKREWLEDCGFPFDHFHAVQYGATKADSIRRYADYAILFDDNRKVRNGWHMGATIDPTAIDIIEYLENLI